ncbi:MAG TPA: Hint domain-containing protein [Alphaproteobacteria bacterium]|nr:Hint domain-containing protein [Alphaproteobacteria bacterium]
MPDYVFYPVTGDGLTQQTAYTWNTGTIDYTSGTDWTAVTSFETLTIGGTVTSGTVPPNGSNVGIVAGAISPQGFAFYQPDPAHGDPYIAGSLFPVDILLNSGAVSLNSLLLSGFNQYASLPFIGGTTPLFPTLDVEGATLSVAGNILDTATVNFPPIDLGFFGTISSGTASGGGTIDIGQGGTVDISGAVPADITFHFQDGNNNVLSIGGDSKGTPTAFNGLITGYTAGDTILLPNVPSFAGGIATTGTYDVATGKLTITVGDPVFIDLNIPGFTNTSGPVNIVANGAGIEVVPCFLKGTRISTAAGEIPVEQLAVGDLARTASGALKPIVWIGSGQALATRGRRDAATPVIVRKGAIAENVPSRDLRITKGHSLYLDGVLIPAEYLINHRSILWDDTAQEVTVYHIELAAHDVLVAEGTPAESYRDDGNRWLFRNANSGWDFPPKPACAPVLTGGPIVDTIWRRLLDRAGPRPSVPTTADPDLHLVIDGTRVDPVSHSKDCYVFRLPICPASARLVSRIGVPAELGVARDPRCLGVAVRQITAWRGATLAMLDASDPSLTDGFHGFEADAGIRWTDGDALLPPALFAGLNGPIELELRVSGTTTYRLESDARGRAAA